MLTRAAVIAILVAGLAGTGCSTGSGGDEGDETVTVYVSLPLQGPSGADGRDAKDAEHRSSGLADQAAPGEGERIHRRANRRPLRRSSAHDARTVAAAPRGTAIETQVSATSGVTWTKTSDVS